MTRCARETLLLLLLGWVLVGPAAKAQEVDPVRYAVVKAGYLLNFLRLTQWPDESFATDESPLVVVVVGHDAMTPFLEDILRDERIGDRRAVVERLTLPEGRPEAIAAGQAADRLQAAHLVYVADDALAHLESIVSVVAGHPVLTVSDIPGFAARRGGMIGLAVREGAVGMEANVGRIEESGVAVSARVLQLASIVGE